MSSIRTKLTTIAAIAAAAVGGATIAKAATSASTAFEHHIGQHAARSPAT